MSRAGSDARGVWGTTRDLHLQVAAHTKEMRALREAPEFLNFLAYAKSRDDAREREEARRASRRGAPARDDAGPAPPSNAASASASAPPRARTRSCPHRDGRSRRGARGVPREGVWSEVGKPYRAGGGSPSRTSRGTSATCSRGASPRARRSRPPQTRRRRRDPNRRRAAAAAAADDDDVPLREFLADGIRPRRFAAARRTNEEGPRTRTKAEEGDEGVLNGTPEASAEARSPSSGPTPEASSSTNTIRREESSSRRRVFASSTRAPRRGAARGAARTPRGSRASACADATRG